MPRRVEVDAVPASVPLANVWLKYGNHLLDSVGYAGFVPVTATHGALMRARADRAVGPLTGMRSRRSRVLVARSLLEAVGGRRG